MRRPSKSTKGSQDYNMDDEDQKKPAATTISGGPRGDCSESNDERRHGRPPVESPQVGGTVSSAPEINVDETVAMLAARIAAGQSFELAAQQLLAVASLRHHLPYQAVGLSHSDIVALTAGVNVNQIRTVVANSAAPMASASAAVLVSAVASVPGATVRQQQSQLLAGQLLTNRTGLGGLLSSNSSRAQQQHHNIPPFASMPKRTTLANAASAGGAAGMAGTGNIPPPAQQHQEVVSRPAPQDVLLGRGKPIQEHPGNEAMRSLVEQHKDRYNSLPRDRRGLVANELISQLQNSGSRFLKRDEFYSNGWVHAKESEVYEKFCHSLRSRPKTNRSNKNHPRDPPRTYSQQGIQICATLQDEDEALVVQQRQLSPEENLAIQMALNRYLQRDDVGNDEDGDENEGLDSRHKNDKSSDDDSEFDNENEMDEAGDSDGRKNDDNGDDTEESGET